MLTDGRTNGQTYGKADAYIAKSGGQGDVSCKVWWLFSLVVDQNTNFDINVERRHKCWQTDRQKIGCLYRALLQAGAIKMNTAPCPATALTWSKCHNSVNKIKSQGKYMSFPKYSWNEYMTEMTIFNVQRAITQKVSKSGLQFSFSADPLMVLYISVKLTSLSQKLLFSMQRPITKKVIEPDTVLVFNMPSYVALDFCEASRKSLKHFQDIERAQVYDWDHYLQCPKGGNSKSR